MKWIALIVLLLLPRLACAQFPPTPTPTPAPIPSPIPNNYCTFSNQIASLDPSKAMAFANQKLTFTTQPPGGVSLQVPGLGSTLPIGPSTQVCQTDATGNILAGCQVPQGAHVNLSVGNGPPIPLVIPASTTCDLTAIMLSQTDPPQVVSAIAVAGPLFAGASVTNPQPGTIGTSTIISPPSFSQTQSTTANVDIGVEGNVQQVILSGNATVNLTDFQNGASFLIDTAENGTGGFTPTFTVPAGFTLQWPSGIPTQPPIPSTIPNAHNLWSFVVFGTTVVGTIVPAQNSVNSTLNFNDYSGTNINSLFTHTLTPPTGTAVVATCSGTCATTYGYQVACLGDNGTTTAATNVVTSVNASALSSSNYNAITWNPETGCYTGYAVYGRTNGSIGLLATTTGTSYIDKGVATPGVPAPLYGSTNTWFGNVMGNVGNVFNVQNSAYAGGAKGDNMTDDSPAFTAAIAACTAARGGIVQVPPTGSMYLLNEGINLGGAASSGCSLEGTGGLYWPGTTDNTASGWSYFGSWIHCADTTNSCVTLAGDGNAVKKLNFWYTQPTPSGPLCGAAPCTMTHGWTPTTYPYTITTTGPGGEFYDISDVNIINATHCIDLEGGTLALGNIYSHLEHLHLGCFMVGTKFNYVDNFVDISDVHYQPWWESNDSGVLGYMEGDAGHVGHKIDWQGSYMSTVHGEGILFGQSYAGMKFTDATSSGGTLGPLTIGGQGIQLSNVQFNQVCQAIILASGTTHLNMRMSNVIVNADPETSTATQCAGAFPTMFELTSDNVDVGIDNLDVFNAQQVFGLGNGSGGTLHLHNYRIGNYSAYSAGGNAFVLFAGAILDPPPDYSVNSIIPSGAPLAGPRVSGGTPTVSAGPAGTTVVGNDSAGIVHVGVDSTTYSVTLNFWRTSYLNPPSCTATDLTTHNWGMQAVASMTQLALASIGSTNNLGTHDISYACKWFR